MRGLQSLFGLPSNPFFRSLFGATLIGFSAAMADPVCRQAFWTRLVQFSNAVSLHRVESQAQTLSYRETITQKSVSVVLVLDLSWSMSHMASEERVKLEALKESSTHLFTTLEKVHADHQTAQHAIGSAVTVINSRYTEKSNNGLHETREDTLAEMKDLYLDIEPNTADAFKAGLDFLSKDGKLTSQQNRVLVFMSDGVNANASDAKRTLKLCNKAKREGITIYSVAFEGTEEGKALLKACASNDNEAEACHETHYFDTHSDNELKRAFEEIGRG